VNTTTLRNYAGPLFALLLGACLLTCSEAQVVLPTPADPQAKPAPDETGIAEQQGGQQPERTAPDGKNRDPANEAIHEASPQRDTDIYALVPVSDLAKLKAPVPATQDVDWLTALVEIAGSVAWPAAILLALWRLLKAPQVEVFLTRLAQRATHINMAGLEIKLSEGAKATLEDLQKLIKQVPETHEEWVTKSHMSMQFHQVVSRLRTFLCQADPRFTAPLTDDDFRQFRFTLHVPDVLLTHSVRQLLDYLGSERAGGGRLFSARRGIVGLAWRLEESQFETRRYTEDELVRTWGMTRVEAKDTKTTVKSVLMAFIIKSPQNLPLGLLYADADESELFVAARNSNRTAQATFDLLDSQVKLLCAESGLTHSLQELEKARVRVKQVDIYRP
jgi:hypothetical protein